MSDSCKICRLTIAGPGAGKTTRMVDIIEECISNVAPNRFIAVITYTNEATKEIQNKLKNRIELPNNLFIGTIHSFLIKFVFESYAHLFDIVSIDKCYIDKIKEFNAEYKDELVTKNGKKGATKIELNYFYKKSEEILESGFVTYDKILEKSHKLILNEKICAIVSNKLQYIFIDEYQDSRYYQHEIIMQILSKGSTSIYAIGDPMQSIFYFSYSTSQLKNELIPESFDEFPINMLENLCATKSEFDCFYLDKNYRSRPNIVAFVNNFNAKLSQKTVRKDNGVPVLFINETNIEKIIEKFLSLKKKYNIKDEDGEEGCRIDNLFLSRGWKCFEEIGLKLGISKISNDDHSSNFIFRDTLGCVLGAIGKNKKQLYEEYGINEIELRKFVLKLIKYIKLENYNFENIFSLQNKIVKNFNKCFNVNLKLNQNLCVEDSLKKIIRTDICQPIIGYYSTIHSAKGLEASSVLVVAENKKLLGKWLLTDKNDLGMYVNDIYRLGFVGFSRARNFLCIACLESILPDFEKTLNNFEVLIDPPFKRPQTTWDLW